MAVELNIHFEDQEPVVNGHPLKYSLDGDVRDKCLAYINDHVVGVAEHYKINGGCNSSVMWWESLIAYEEEVAYDATYINALTHFPYFKFGIKEKDELVKKILSGEGTNISQVRRLITYGLIKGTLTPTLINVDEVAISVPYQPNIWFVKRGRARLTDERGLIIENKDMIAMLRQLLKI